METATTKRRSTAVGGAQSVERNMNGERPTGYWWYKQVSVPVRPIQSIATSLCERSRKFIMEGLRNFLKKWTFVVLWKVTI